MREFTSEQLDKLISSGNPVIVDFFATWCGPCKMFAPIFESAAAKAGDAAEFGKVDIDASPEIAERYGIMSVPTVMMFRNGEIVHRSSGIMNETSLLGLLDK